MAEKYTVSTLSVDTVLGFIKSGEIAIPEIQRPFVWKARQVRDLLTSAVLIHFAQDNGHGCFYIYKKRFIGCNVVTSPMLQRYNLYSKKQKIVIADGVTL